MTVDQRGAREGGFPALSLFARICCACVLASLVSCSNSFSAQESLVKDLFEAARNHDLSKASKLMPRMSQLTPRSRRLRWTISPRSARTKSRAAEKTAKQCS